MTVHVRWVPDVPGADSQPIGCFLRQDGTGYRTEPCPLCGQQVKLRVADGGVLAMEAEKRDILHYCTNPFCTYAHVDHVDWGAMG